ncbi:MAX dimerization protein MGA a isoform X5 [Boleophthalmus pectinirostris]|uniref:MAX dimerization protein MGA a isoform X5 n=1 Tax=Boleophthalmus pectinirostris TaxID=150288 RepID=UPI00242A3DCB|nr:MAX dimerization protein MGA a isoform X5 [Boleophthalmus pectinirostris]
MAQAQQREMVLLQEEPPGRAPSAGGHRWSEERGKSNPHPQKEPRPDENLPPECVLRGIRVTLDNNSMWNEFHRCSTEMIVTKQGGRMFPYCRFRLSGLSPHKKYSLLMDLRPADAHRYRWGGRGWQVCGRAQSPVPTPPFAHPDSPASGQHWMQSPVSFYRLKLTSDADDRSGNAVLHLNQRYLPHLHVVQTDRAKDVKLSGPGVVTFTFPQTEFMAVSLYHNNRLTQLKVQYNPFSKGLKDEAAAKGLKQNPTEPGPGQNPLKKSLKSLLANHKPKSSKPTEPKGEPKGEPRETPKTSADQPRSSSTDRPKSCSRDQPKSRDQSESAAKAPSEQTCPAPPPSQKLFSERIREAHVALQRCNLSQYEVHNISSERTPQNSAKDSEKEGTKGQNCTKNAEKPRKDCFVSGKDDARTEVCKENKPVASTASKSEPSSEAKVQKRPPTLPLSALGRFLKQHSAKSKKAKVETDHAKEADNAKTVKDRMVQTNSQLESRKTETKLEPSLSESKDVTDPLTAAERKEPKTDLPVENAVSHKPENKLKLSCSSTKKQENFIEDVQNSESKEKSEHLHQSKQESCATEIPESNCKSTESQSERLPVTLPEPSDQVFTVRNVPKPRKKRKKSKWHKPKPKPPAQISHSDPGLGRRTLSPQKDTEPRETDQCLVSDSTVLQTSPPPPFCALSSISPPLPDPECATFGFEPLSPASSPEPLPALPESLALDLEPQENIPETAPDPEKDESKPGSSVFKWHTVLPPAEQSLAAPFSPFHPSASPSDLASQSENGGPSLAPEAAAFQEQSLPFPGDLSPLALQFPVSPTFSSLDGDALSPTDLTELVHFFAGADADLGIGEEFSNAAAEEQTPQLTEERSEERSEERLEERSEETSKERSEEMTEPQTEVRTDHVRADQVRTDQVRLELTPRAQRRRKRRRGAAKVELEPELDPSYSVMKPSLEEVEEQLFVSFTSKEALELHIGDSPENSQTDPAPSVQTDPAPSASPGPAPLIQNGPAPSVLCSTDFKRITVSLKETRPDSSPPASSPPASSPPASSPPASSPPASSPPASSPPASSPPASSPTLEGDKETERKPNKEAGGRRRHKEPQRELNEELERETAAASTNNEDTNEDANGTDLKDAQNKEPSRTDPDREPENIQQSSEEHVCVSLEQQIFEFEQILLRDVKLMKHKQVIHPELQQVGLKMSLLDPSLPVDLQYLGIPLPLPPPGTNQEPSLSDAGGATGAFVSRTGKTTDVTQIKGWRDKYDSALPPEAPPVPEPKKNLSAFCSDMLDEYLETEGKLIDERASSFTAPDPAPSLASYVRTLTCTVKANAAADISTSDIISGFVPPSKRPKPPPNRAAKKTFKHKRKLGRRDENAKVTTKEEEQSKAPPSVQNEELSDVSKLKKLRETRRLFKAGFNDDAPTIHLKKFGENEEDPSLETENTMDSYDYDFTEPLSHSPKPQKKQKLRSDAFPKENSSNFDSFSESSRLSAHEFDHTEPISDPTESGPSRVKRRRRRRRRSEELELMAPLESDSELCAEETDRKPTNQSQSAHDTANQRQEEAESRRANQSRPLVTKALVKQRDLEQRGFWEGKQRTYITRERATVALSSLFTLKGFVEDDPRLPVRLAPRPPPRCLNDFCRLGCMCSSLAHRARSAHCGRALCMLRCTCLKQKVVLLRNIDSSDGSSPRRPPKKKRRRRRMKMAYVLKEAESVSQPASPVRTLWVRTRDQDQDQDVDPVCVPAVCASSLHTTHQVKAGAEEGHSCARIRSFSERKRRKRPDSDSAPPGETHLNMLNKLSSAHTSDVSRSNAGSGSGSGSGSGFGSGSGAVLRDGEHLSKEPSDPTVTTECEESRSCARIREFSGRSKRKQKPPESDKPSAPSGRRRRRGGGRGDGLAPRRRPAGAVRA